MAKTENKYLQKLDCSEWREKREEILERDGHQCRICDNREHLQVHHTIYLNGKQPWEYENETLVTLCDNCHLDTENNIGKIKWLVGKLQQIDPSITDRIVVLLSRQLDPSDLYDFKGMEFKHG